MQKMKSKIIKCIKPANVVVSESDTKHWKQYVKKVNN
jgi:hypothetical protein